MSFIDKYYTIFNNSAGQHSVTINRAEFANLLGVFSKQEQQLDQLKKELKDMTVRKIDYLKESLKYKQTLREIKEIADKENNDIKVLYNRRTHQRMKQILQKISEVME